MHFRSAVILIVLLVSISCSRNNSPVPSLEPADIDVLILSRYALKSVEIAFDKARIFLPDRTLEQDNKTLTFHLKSGSIYFSKYSAKYINIANEGFFTISSKKAKFRRRIYSGDLTIKAGKNLMEFIARVPVEDYVHASAAAELGTFLSLRSSSPMEAWQLELLKAMEVSIRSYFFHFKDRHSSPDYAFCDLTHCVYFPGIVPGSNPLTVGEVMLDKSGNFVPAYFHSTCGGELTGPEAYWEGHEQEISFRRGRDSAADSEILCSESPHSVWRVFVKSEDINRITGLAVKDIRPVYNNKSARVLLLEFTTDSGKRTIPASDFISRSGRVLGWHVIKSNYFRISKFPSGWKFAGHGLGHGVGMCQWGASALAKKGYTYREILEFYYNSPDIVKGKYNEKN